MAPCANCKKQVREVCEDNGLEDVQVVGLHDLLMLAIDFGPPPGEQKREERLNKNRLAGKENFVGKIEHPHSCEGFFRKVWKNLEGA